MTMRHDQAVIRRFAPSAVSVLGDDECEVTVCTRNLALDDDVWVMEGIDLSRFLAHPVALRDHDPTQPVARASDLKVAADRITAKATFAPLGISPKADETRGLVKSGFITGVSAGIIPLESEPLDPRNPRGGRRITRAILIEFSFVSVPSDAASGVTGRSRGEKRVADDQDWKVGAAKGLPIEDSDDWDGAAAQASIFEWAGGDDFDSAKARKGFLVYDASAPDKRGSYKLPIAHVSGGELKVPKGAIRAAASRLPDTDIPDDVKTAAGKVLAAYEKAAGIGEEDDAKGGERRSPRTTKRVKVGAHVVRTGPVTFKRGLYQVAGLAYLLGELGYQLDMAKWEAECEGDQSKVPAMLAAVLQDLGDALLAMTAEEVAELLAGHGLEAEDCDDDEVLIVEERTHVRAAKSPRVRAFRRALALAKLRAGKTLSAETVRCMREAMAHHDAAMELHRSAIRAHKQGLEVMDNLLDDAGAADDDADPEAPDDDTADDDATRARRARALQLKAKAFDFAA